MTYSDLENRLIIYILNLRLLLDELHAKLGDTIILEI
jgi:hypothetical protein